MEHGWCCQVLIGSDGVHSVVARWLGLPEPASSGRSAVCGLSIFPNGHGIRRELWQFFSPGLWAGMVPISDTDVYWFLVNDTAPAGKPCRRTRRTASSSSSQIHPLLRSSAPPLPHLYLQRKKLPGTRP